MKALQLEKKNMNIDEKHFPYLKILMSKDENINVIYYLGDQSHGLAIRINQKYKRIEICQEAFTDLKMFMEYEAIDGLSKLSYEKIHDPTSLIPRTMVKFDKDILNEWLMAFNQLSKHNKLKIMIIKKNQLIEIVDNL